MGIDSVLVTGGAGFIGSALVDRLLEDGTKVIVVDNLTTGFEQNIPDGATVIQGSTADKATYQELNEHEQIDAVFHLAGQSSGEGSFDDPEYDFESHAVGAFKLLRWCHSSDVNRLLFGSSMSVYGDPEYLPVDESHPVDPKTYYAAGKLAAESYVKLFDNLGMDNTIFRMFSIYGPGQNLTNMKQGMVSIYLTFLLEEDRILVKGPLDRFRDFVYIDDVVDIWTDAVENQATYGETYNLARGEKIDVETLIDTMIDCYGLDDFPVEVTEGTPGDQFGIYGDASKIERDIGRSPDTSLEEGLTRMIQAESENS